MNVKTMIKTKTFWGGISGIVAAVAGVMTGTMDPGTAVQTAIGSLLAVFLRDGIAKG